MTATETETPPEAGRPHAIRFIFIVVLLDMLAAGVTLPIIPGLIKDLIGGDAALAARYVGWFAALWAVIHFFAAPVIGALSDRYGRRPVLLASMFGQALDFLMMALAPTVALLFIGRAISGLTSASAPTANAYVADITPPEQRAGRMGVMNAAFGLGLIGGPFLGGLLGHIHPRLPFWFAGGLCLLNGLYGLFVVPESLKRENRAPFNPRLANPFGSLALLVSRPGLASLAAIIFLSLLSQQVLNSTGVPYVTYRFQWSTGAIGLALMLMGVMAVVMTVMVRWVVMRVGERWTLYAGLTGTLAGFMIYGAASGGTVFMTGIPLVAMIGLAGPAISAQMTRMVEVSEQGRLQGAVAGLVAIASIIGPLLFTEVFARAIGPWSSWAPMGSPFYVAAALLAAALVIAGLSRPRPASS